MVQDKLEFLKDLCKKYKIGLVYLFGSQKEKAYQLLKNNDDYNIKIDDPLTDIDVGIVFLFDLDNIKHRYKLYASIYNELEELFKPYKLDLVFLQETHSVFQTEALKGICVYSESESFKDEYEMMILRRAADFKYVLDLYHKEVLENSRRNEISQKSSTFSIMASPLSFKIRWAFLLPIFLTLVRGILKYSPSILKTFASLL